MDKKANLNRVKNELLFLSVLKQKKVLVIFSLFLSCLLIYCEEFCIKLLLDGKVVQNEHYVSEFFCQTLD